MKCILLPLYCAQTIEKSKSIWKIQIFKIETFTKLFALHSCLNFLNVLLNFYINFLQSNALLNYVMSHGFSLRIENTDWMIITFCWEFKISKVIWSINLPEFNCVWWNLTNFPHHTIEHGSTLHPMRHNAIASPNKPDILANKRSIHRSKDWKILTKRSKVQKTNFAVAANYPHQSCMTFCLVFWWISLNPL